MPPLGHPVQRRLRLDFKSLPSLTVHSPHQVVSPWGNLQLMTDDPVDGQLAVQPSLYGSIVMFRRAAELGNRIEALELELAGTKAP